MSKGNMVESHDNPDVAKLMAQGATGTVIGVSGRLVSFIELAEGDVVSCGTMTPADARVHADRIVSCADLAQSFADSADFPELDENHPDLGYSPDEHVI